MKIIRCSCQNSQSLSDYYQELYPEDSPVMNEFLDLLEKTSSPLVVYGLTSHEDLVFQPSDEYSPPWLVIVSIRQEQVFEVRYRLPMQSAPWPNAYVVGEAKGPKEAVDRVLVAMRLSGGFH